MEASLFLVEAAWNVEMPHVLGENNDQRYGTEIEIRRYNEILNQRLGESKREREIERKKWRLGERKGDW